MLYGTIAALSALLLTAVLTRFVRAFALRTGMVDRPGGRKAHARPTPHLGGVAVAAGTLTVACTGYAPLGPGIATLLGAAGAVALLGLVDDLRPLAAGPRLLVETVAAGVVVYGTDISPAAGVLAVAWIVFITNAFNLLDNSDGAMGTVAVVTALGLALCAAAEGLPGLALLLTVLAASLAGFLTLNWHPARIFLGDCGSLFTGFLLASSAVLVHTGHDALPSAVGLFALTVAATADTLLVLLSRRRAGRPVLLGGTDHIAHRLRRLGFTVPGAAVVLGALALVGALTGVLVHRGAVGPHGGTPLAGAVVVVVWALLKVPVYKRSGATAVVKRPLTASPTLTAGRARTSSALPAGSRAAGRHGWAQAKVPSALNGNPRPTPLQGAAKAAARVAGPRKTRVAMPKLALPGVRRRTQPTSPAQARG
ncbi:MraY family glycosyltransferase [Streptomyces sp. NBC_01304]|uniref:MraY family glycosyltransferase n=1 Tax=Streptomyces sp. NBC_01304 TaxID=2903818 RepID=UPI002E10B1CC|nr:undecaprenyl/decaprenyl-phosphate alpha-N-acetylglucosaminyl 1-phosphate transferase [Streptomyces sp. NBC_01304]